MSTDFDASDPTGAIAQREPIDPIADTLRTALQRVA